jgi:hypothetical protein
VSAIYSDQHSGLKELLASAGHAAEATLLIPDLQRPYVWTPSQVVVLVDSLIRGWPFGTLLTWKVRPDDEIRALARPFWSVVNRTTTGDGEPINMMHPPATFQMVLDGQQRVQSLLIALCGDGWGFKLLDRQWHEYLNGTKPRGPRGKPHWSLGCLCVDVPALCEAYSHTKRATAIDYASVLRWAITDDANGQSKFNKPITYIEPLPRASDSAGRFVRLSRLWQAAPEEAGVDPYETEELADAILEEHGVPADVRVQQRRAAGALLTALKDVKQTRVTYLQLAEYQGALGSREVYNDAVVNIFTRLNTAGRTLTREDITFAWLKIGWDPASTGSQSAKACIEQLTQRLESLALRLPVEDVVSAISLVWAVSFNSGKLLNNNDLMKGEAIRPMAAQVSKYWDLVEEAAIQVCSIAFDRGLRFREHYQSVNSLAYLWAWYFAALRWQFGHRLTEPERDSFEKSLRDVLDDHMDRWLICSQWAGIWASSSAQSLGGYASRLAACAEGLLEVPSLTPAISTLREQLNTEVGGVEQSAVNSLNVLNADDRQQVRGYYTPLWIWNRLDTIRWQKAKVALREGRRQVSLDVDHVVAYDLWEKKIKERQIPDADETALVIDNLEGLVNQLGNCMLLEKNFNISKSNKTLKQFLESVHEFVHGTFTIDVWGESLSLEMPQIDCTDTSVETLAEMFEIRTRTIKADLEQFVRGAKKRVDIENV